MAGKEIDLSKYNESELVDLRKAIEKEGMRRLRTLESDTERLRGMLNLVAPTAAAGSSGRGKGVRVAKGSGKGTNAAKTIPQVFANAFGTNHSGEKTAKQVEEYVKGKKGKFRPLTPFIKGKLLEEAGKAAKAEGTKGKAATLYRLTATGKENIKAE